MMITDEQKEHLIKLQQKSKNDLDKILGDYKASNSFDDDSYLALMKFLIDCKKLRLNEREIEAQLKNIGFNEEQIQQILNFLQAQQNIIPSNQLRFRDLEWRLEAKIASKSSHNIQNIEPKILLKFALSDESSVQHRNKISATGSELFVETNATNLVHIVQKLEQAMSEAKSHRILHQ